MSMSLSRTIPTSGMKKYFIFWDRRGGIDGSLLQLFNCLCVTEKKFRINWCIWVKTTFTAETLSRLACIVFILVYNWDGVG
jgi:hypothetical protein